MQLYTFTGHPENDPAKGRRLTMRKNHMKRLKTVCAVLFALLTLSAAFPSGSSVSAENASPGVETVRLGYFNFQNYMLGAEKGAAKSGYVYDLLCDIAAINNWKYDFIYGDFNDLYAMLLDGQIDILPCLVYTEERAAAHLFSEEEIYAEKYFISVLNQNAAGITDVRDLDGKKLSTVTDTHQNTAFAEWAEKQGISMELLCTGSYEDSWAQLKNGKADFILNIDSAAQDSGYTTLFGVGSGSSRFAIAPGRKDLLEKINRATETIHEINPFSIDHLKEKYLSDTLSSFRLSEEELAWLEGKDRIRIAGFLDNAPYTFIDKNGRVAGVYPDAVRMMFEKLGITVPLEWTLYGSEEEMLLSLSGGRSDLVCPFYHDHFRAQEDGVIISEKFIEASMGMLIAGQTDEHEIRRIAIPDTRVNRSFVAENYPSAKIIPFGTVENCVSAVATDRADAAVATSSLLEDKSYQYFKTFQLKTLAASCPICFAANPKDGMLICIVNRGLHLVLDTDLQSLALVYAPERSSSLWDFFKNNKLLSGLILLALALIIFIAADRSAASGKLKKSLDEITRQKEIIEADEEKLLVATEAANAASRAKSTFLFNMSHDIRTPMNAILGYSDRMLKHLDDRAIVKDSAGKIRSSGEHLLSLINDVLDMARIESDKIRLDEDIHDLREKCESLNDVFEVNMQKKDLTFRVDFSGMKDVLLWYDSLKLRQILMNLLSNAVKYTPAGGTVTHTVRQLESSRPGYARYAFTVSDTGIGMSPEFVSHIFEPFSRSDDSITKETQGTGLGMSIVGKLTELMGGTVSIRSEAGRGTEITVTLDLRIATEEELRKWEEARQPAGEQISLKDLRVLLVDDNELNREILQEILEDEGCVVAGIAENGAVAVEKIRTSRPGDYDLVLMDVQMPVMDGYEATRRIRALGDKALSSVPILAMTANAFEEDRQNALAAGMNAHLTKPVDIRKLRETLAKYV